MVIMKKIIILLLVIICTGCSFNKEIKNNEEIKYDDSYIEIIPPNAIDFIKENDNEIILTLEEIEKYNEEIKTKTDSIFDLYKINKLTNEEISNLINKYKVPTLPKYNDLEEVTTSQINEMLDNRNLLNIADEVTVKKGIIVKRANLKSFPTAIHFYEQKGISNFDQIQETELHVNTPILIVHQSKDREYSFVIAYNYCGWVNNNDIALAKDEDWDYFINNNSFGIITLALLEIDNTILDMSTKLPYVEVTKDGYKFMLPVKGEDGFVTKKEIIISRDKAHIGYLPYNKRNVYIQAFKYEGIPYKWSGMDNGVDCSSYVANIFRTFGFMFPRNTAHQNSSVGEIIDLSNKSNLEKLNIIKGNETSLLYQVGHVMIYLGEKEGTFYVIHASGSTLQVSVTELNNSSYLNNINKLVLIR